VLKDWLYSSNGETRDLTTLRVVSGCSEEYPAAEQNGKLEYTGKELELKKTIANSVSLSEVSNRRSSWTSSGRFSRPTSLSFSWTNSDTSFVTRAPSDLFTALAIRMSELFVTWQWSVEENEATGGDRPVSPTKSTSGNLELQ
jgi:hypothetical protein